MRTPEAAALGGDIVKDSIRFGLYSIKNFGRGVADEIIAERKKGGAFTSLSDFLSRLARPATAEGVHTQQLNKKGLESLIMCGALDSLGERGVMLANLELILEFYRSSKDSQADSLFSDLGGANELKLKSAVPAPMSERLKWEKELLGLYVSGHPLEQVKDKLQKRPMSIGQVRERVRPGASAVAAGMIEDVRVILTRGGDQMAFIKLMDEGSSIEAVVFPKDFATYKSILKPEACIALKGRMSNRNGELSLVAEALKAL